MDDEDIYDEFGNLINPSVAQDDASSSDEDGDNFNFFGTNIDEDDQDGDSDEDHNEEEQLGTHSSLILHEEKKYFPSVEEVYGADVETVVATTDAMDISEPLVEPEIEKQAKIEEKELPQTTYSKQYMWEISKLPSKVRNVALVGSLHSGKTSLLDLFILETHDIKIRRDMKNYKPLRYTDNHTLEVQRGISIKSSTMSLLLPNLKENSLITNIIDCPGHVNFMDEMAVGVRSADSCVLVVDVVEGLTKGLEMSIEHAIRTNTTMTLVINKIDRLILELRLPPVDAYMKIRYVIKEINDYSNEILESASSDPVKIDRSKYRFSPERGNVCFSSAKLNFCFSLRSFAKLYIERQQISNEKLSIDDLARRLWGDIYLIDGKFTSKPANKVSSANKRSFVILILEPIYKLVTHSLTKEPKDLQSFLYKSLGISRIPSSVFKLDVEILLKEIFRSFLGKPSMAFTDMIENHSSSPYDNAENKLNDIIIDTKNTNANILSAIKNCDPDGPLIAYVTKLIDTQDASRFYAQVRVLSGTLKIGEDVRLLGESFSEDYDEDWKQQDIRKLYLSCGRYKIGVDKLYAGSVGLVAGYEIDKFITKTASLFDMSFELNQLSIFKPLDFINEPLFKVIIQPLDPFELSQLVEGLKKLNKSYSGCEVKVEEGGDHVIHGSGELYMDCVLHDLRKLYTDIEIKVSDPTTKFTETSIDMSNVKLTIESTNKRNRITIICEPIDSKIGEDIKNGKISILKNTRRQIAKFFKTNYNFDSLEARSILSFGPNDEDGSCLLVDDTIDGESDKERLHEFKDSIIQGFKWATREGPLCDETIRNVKFKILEIELADNYLDCNGAQLIQMTRNACYSSFMIGTPKLMEPIYQIDVTCYYNVVTKLNQLLDRRRGNILTSSPIAGTSLYKVVGLVPVIDSVGLETDIRLLTQGQAMCYLTFAKWQIVPGDPLDKDAFIPFLRPAPIKSLARDFTMKTRKRKGIDGEPTLQKYVDSLTYTKLKDAGIIS
ncbi:hypothetical protein B5S33_g5387 [[Candida] boidinii]|nr:hypothetical protein B5S33_g5387 [[Candida] boidinii]